MTTYPNHPDDKAFDNDATPCVLAEHKDGVETWTLNLPETRNPISDPAVVAALVDHLARVANDLTVGAIVLTGAGTAFSAGGDVRAMQERTGMFGAPPPEQRRGYQQGIQRLTRAMVECDIPIIAAVNGPAIGAGFDLALMCDLRIASSSASFAESFVKLGLVPGDGGAWLLPRVVGHARASELALTGRRIDAATAQHWGIVSDVVAPEDLLVRAHDLAREIAALPREAVRMTKSLLRKAPDIGLDATLELSAAMQPLCHTTDDHRDAVATLGVRRR
ncbi:crotonase/enoyl-CoA hydratase family protein [Rhodococcus artemisiae]|uniref:Crotonase/enoyl-CoA hydratase family protein n=1 Tax=Rhodococcus artemisiae TaxID=714159 RepID=A0ABU7LBT3_9NOCA|nr:crotonase/enoyl-CoA hydratase family protein [Rhodococcus artemisiae]MEE2059003.1 crotonase/enoyl-CoA hydratase family protein [Rhodococcus artemisiae]